MSVQELFKDRRIVSAAIGLAFVLIVAKWAFTGSLATNVSILQGSVVHDVQTEDGKTKAEPVPKSVAILDFFLDGVIGVLAWIGGVLIQGALWTARVAKHEYEQFTAQPQAPPQPAVNSSQPLPEAPQRTDNRLEDALELARAAAVNQFDKLELFRVKFRWPRATEELASWLEEVASQAAKARTLPADDPSLSGIRQALTNAWAEFDDLVIELKKLSLPTESEVKAKKGAAK